MATNSLDVVSLQETLCKAGAYMAATVRLEDSIVFVGTANSGKSTLINFLIGNKLIGEKEDEKIYINKADNSHGPQIGAAGSSENAIPARYVTEKFSGCALWDASDFDDNRADDQDICNAYCNSELFRNSKSAKIILVLDFVALQGDSRNVLRTSLKGIESLLANKFRDCFPSIAMIITKVDTLNGIPVTKEVIADLLQNKILSSKDIEVSQDAENFVKYLIDHPQNIGFFKKATEGPVTDAIADSIVESINNLQAIPTKILKAILPSISKSAIVTLLRIYEKLMSMQEFRDLQNVAVTVLEERLQDADNRRNKELSSSELFDFLLEMGFIKEKIEKVVNDHISFDKKIHVLKMTDVQIEFYIDMHKLCEKAKYVYFVDRLLNLGESRNFNISIMNNLFQATQKIAELVAWLKWQISKECKHN